MGSNPSGGGQGAGPQMGGPGLEGGADPGAPLAGFGDILGSPANQTQEADQRWGQLRQRNQFSDFWSSMFGGGDQQFGGGGGGGFGGGGGSGGK